MTACTWRYGTMALYIGLASGFIFVGPVLGVGLYSISRQLQEGRKPVLGYCIREGQQHLQSEALREHAEDLSIRRADDLIKIQPWSHFVA